MADFFSASQTLSTRYTPEPQDGEALKRRKRRAVYGQPVAAAQAHQPIVIDVRHLAWQLNAACAGMNHELFFDSDTAPEVCASCPVRQACEDYANEHRLVGCWGGKTQAERRRDKERERARSRRTTRA